MSGHRWLILLPVISLLASIGCQTDGGSRASWNPFRKNVDADAVADADSPSSFTMPRFNRRKDETADAESSGTNTPMATEQLERLLAQGRVALQENRLDEAKKAYGDVIASVPDNATAHHGLAMAADLAEEWDDAEYHYRQALRVRPRDPDLLCDIGYSYLLQNRYSESERYLSHALEVSPQHESALMNLAMLDLRQGKRASAEQRLAERYGAAGKANQVLVQLEDQVASMRGGIIPASATAVTAPINGNAFRPDMTASRGNGAGQGLPEIPANASLEEALEIARREGAEAERLRTLQKIGRDPMIANGGAAPPVAPAANSNQPSNQPSAWPANSGAANPGFNGTMPNMAMSNAATGQGAMSPGMSGNVSTPATNPVANSAAIAGPPVSIFGTLQPRNSDQMNSNGQNPQPGAAPGNGLPNSGTLQNVPSQYGPPMAGQGTVDPTQWANSRILQNSPVAGAFQNSISNAGSMANNVIADGNRAAAGLGNAANSMAGSLSANMSNAGSFAPGFGGQNLQGGNQPNSSSSNVSHGNSMASSGAGQGTSSASLPNVPNGGAPIAVRSSGAFQPAANAGNSYGVPYGFGSNSGQTPVNTVSSSNTTSMNGQPAGSGSQGSNAIRPASQGMYLDGLNVGPGSLFPVYPNNAGMNSNGMPAGNPNGSPQFGSPNSPSPDNASMMNGSNPQSGMQLGANMNPRASNANSNPPNRALRMGNISSPGSGSMINGAMYSQPDSTLPSAGVVSGGGINTTSNLPGWPGSRPVQANALESYERQRQQLDDEYNRTLEQLDRNNPTSSSRAQY